MHGCEVWTDAYPALRGSWMQASRMPGQQPLVIGLQRLGKMHPVQEVLVFTLLKFAILLYYVLLQLILLEYRHGR